jgi:hypothetical protein
MSGTNILGTIGIAVVIYLIDSLLRRSIVNLVEQIAGDEA